MADDLTLVLAEALSRLESGLEVDDWLRKRAPARWREVHRLLDLHHRMAERAPPVPRVGRYRLLRELGRGGMGVVYLAEDPESSGTRVAVKLLLPQLVAHGNAAQRFLREARLGIRVRDPRVVATLDAGTDAGGREGMPWVATEFVEGRTLRSLIDEMGQVPEDLCRHVACEVAGALSVLHRAGIVHRDVRPENVMIDTSERVRLMDLGLALAADDDETGAANAAAFTGSVAYAAPEQLLGAQSVDRRADLYALGVVLWEMASGRHPSADELPGSADRRLPSLRRSGAPVSPFFDAVVATLLAVHPDDRFRSADALLRCLSEGTRGKWWRDHAPAGEASAAAEAAAREMPFAGRTEQLDAVDAAWLDVAEQSGRVLFLTGDAGVGRSRFLDEAAARIGSGGDAAIVRVTFPPGPPFAGVGPVVDALRDLASDAKGRRLAEECGLARVGGAVPGAADLDAIRAAVVQFVRAVAQDTPVLLLVDDVQSADAEGRALVHALAQAFADVPALAVLASRPDVDPSWRDDVLRLAHTQTLALAPLGADEVTRLLALRYGSAAVAEELLPDVASAAGNPRFLREVLRELERVGRVHRLADGRWSVDRTAHSGVPESVRDLLRAQVDALTEADRALVETAACLGPRFDPAFLAEVLGAAPLAILRELTRIRRAGGILRSEGEASAFDPPVAHDVVYGAIPAATRAAQHARISGAYRRRVAAAESPSAADVVGCVWHAVRSGNAKGMLLHALAAVRELVRQHDNDRAAEVAAAFLELPRGLRGAPRVEMLLETAVVDDRAGLRERMRKTLEEAVAVASRARSARLLAQARLALARCVFDQGDFRAAWNVLSQLRRSGWRKLSVSERCEAAELLGRCGIRLGKRAESRAALREALRHARASKDLRRESAAEIALGALARDEGRVDAVRRHFERAVDLARRSGDLAAEARAIGNLGAMLDGLGDRHAAIRHLRRQLDAARTVGHRPSESTARLALPRVFVGLGRLADAWEASASARTFAQETGAADLQAIVDVNSAVIAKSLGRFEEARSLADHAIAVAEAGGHRSLHGFALIQRARLREASGELDAARSDLRAATEQFAATGSTRWLSSIRLAQGILAEREGDHAAARPFFTACLAEARRNEIGDNEALATAHLRMIAQGAGAGGPRLVEPGPEVWATERMEWNWIVFQGSGDRRRLEAAYRILAQLRRYAPAADRRAMVERVPLHRAIWDAWHGKRAARVLEAEEE